MIQALNITMFSHILGIFPIILGGLETCSNPNPVQWLLVISLIGASGLLAVASSSAFVAVAATMIPMIIAGETIADILTAITGSVAVSAGGLEILTGVVFGIKNILGC
jgi:energy-converting hydrogenase Eha subunit C